MALAPVRNRTNQANYLKVGSKFEFMGKGFKDLDEEPGSQTKSVKYINDVSTSKGITGYEWQSPFNIDQIRSEKAIDFIVSIGELQKVGADAETEYVNVDLDKPEGGSSNEYRARKFDVAVEVSKLGNDDGQMTGEGNLLGIGDVTPGKFNVETGVFTADA